MSPLANRYLTPEQLGDDGAVLSRCTRWSASECFLVQLEEFETPDAIFPTTPISRRSRRAGSSTPAATSRWRSSASASAPRASVVEIASNDGYLLAVLRRARHPGARRRAGRQRRRGRGRAKGIPTVVEFFGGETARAGSPADRARRPADRQQRARPRARPQRLRRRPAASLLEPRRRDHDGVPAPAAADRGEPVRHDLPRALLLLLAADRAARVRRARPAVFDVEELPTHGGSLRIFARHADDAAAPATERVARALGSASDDAGLRRASTTYTAFAERVAERKREILRVPDRRSSATGSAIVGYGAPAKGNTLLNYCGIGTGLHRLHRRPAARTSRAGTCPARTSRSARPTRIREDQPDVVLILPWNLRDEIIEQLALHPRLGRALRRARPGARGCVVKVRRDAARRRLRRRARAARGRARLLRADVRRGRVRRARARPGGRPVPTSRSTASAARCAGCTARPRRTGRRKLVRCTRGAVYDVLVDLRAGSPTLRALVRRSS